MTLLDRTSPPGPLPVRPRGARPRRRRSTVLTRTGRWLADRRTDLRWLVPLLVAGALVHAWGMDRAPQRVDDEGTYVAQAYAVQHLGELAHYTYWYDHPPLGWLQIAAWTWSTDGFGRASTAVGAGREAMLVAHLASMVLVWALARRMELSRPASAAAVLAFALSPLAVAYHRMVYLDNVAVPWLLAAFVLAASRKHQLASFAGSATCFVLAVLTKETFLLLLPPLAWWMWSHADARTRRYTMTVAGSLVVLLGLAYVMFAVLRGELLTGREHVSLVEGIRFQLMERESSGSILDRTSQSSDTVRIWLSLDRVLLAAGAVGAVVLLAVRRLRPIAVAFLLPLVLMLRPGYLPVPYVVVMLPFAALAAVAAVELGVRHRGPARAVAIVAGALVLGLAGPAWAQGLGHLVRSDTDQPMASAEQWVHANAGPKDRVLVDDAVWVDLVEEGMPRDHVVWYYKADTDPEVMATTPGGWQDYDYLLVTESVRRSLEAEGTAPGGGIYPVLAQAFRSSSVVAAFGEGNERVEVRRVSTSGTTP